MLVKLVRSIWATKKTKEQPYWCPVCNRKQETFSHLPNFYLENARRFGFEHLENAEMLSIRSYSCPDCGASDRERLYALWIEQEIEKNSFPNRIRVIHFAPEPALSRKLQGIELFDYKTADLLKNDVDYKIDIMDMPFKNEYFDLFLCSHVLEHVENDDYAIKELYRITKPGGRGILIVPLIMGLEKTLEDPSVRDESSRWRLYGQHDHVRLYARNDYVRKIQFHGFSVEELGESYFSKEIFDLLGLTRTSTLYIVTK